MLRSVLSGPGRWRGTAVVLALVLVFPAIAPVVVSQADAETVPTMCKCGCGNPQGACCCTARPTSPLAMRCAGSTDPDVSSPHGNPPLGPPEPISVPVPEFSSRHIAALPTGNNRLRPASRDSPSKILTPSVRITKKIEQNGLARTLEGSASKRSHHVCPSPLVSSVSCRGSTDFLLSVRLRRGGDRTQRRIHETRHARQLGSHRRYHSDSRTGRGRRRPDPFHHTDGRRIGGSP